MVLIKVLIQYSMKKLKHLKVDMKLYHLQVTSLYII